MFWKFQCCATAFISIRSYKKGIVQYQDEFDQFQIPVGWWDVVDDLVKILLPCMKATGYVERNGVGCSSNASFSKFPFSDASISIILPVLDTLIQNLQALEDFKSRQGAKCRDVLLHDIKTRWQHDLSYGTLEYVSFLLFIEFFFIFRTQNSPNFFFCSLQAIDGGISVEPLCEELQPEDVECASGLVLLEAAVRGVPLFACRWVCVVMYIFIIHMF